MNSYFVYILTSQRNGTLYIGVTNDLERRAYQHADKQLEGFTKRYGVDRLVYFEETNSIETAILREKQLKRWNRAWKVELIEKHNPEWKDLKEEMFNWIPNQVGNDRVEQKSAKN